jgi:hypothetical protein
MVSENGHETSAADLYQAYEKWCEANSFAAKSQQAFAVRLDALGYEKTRGKIYSYANVRLEAAGLSAGTVRSISKQTATDIALAHREIETAEALLAKISTEWIEGSVPDLRDTFGRPVDCLELGVPNGQGNTRLFNVPFPLAKSVIEAHIAAQRQRLSILSIQAMNELRGLLHPEEAAHPDDLAVDRFVLRMKSKLKVARETKGRGGWEDRGQVSKATLSGMLRAHVAKGDPVDVANFCMFLAMRGETIVSEAT